MLVQFLKALQFSTMGHNGGHQRAETQKMCDNKGPARFPKSDPPGIDKSLEGPAGYEGVCELLIKVIPSHTMCSNPQGTSRNIPKQMPLPCKKIN